MDARTNAAYARVDARLTELLARCLLRPTVELARDVRSGDLVAALEGMLADDGENDVRESLDKICACGTQLEGKDDDAARLVLEVDYNRLFVGPGKLLAPPYESFYKTAAGEDGRGRLRGPAERAVLEQYREHGFTMPEQFVDFPDHIAIELEFLAMMTQKESELWESGDEQAALLQQGSADAFRKQHPASWFDRFMDGVVSGSHTTFYPAVVSLARCAVL